ncbi:MAG: cbb3-type cytochrome c oxidase subunit 3 [Methylotenera sp.]|nr:cbb3-type cytochrome c oxidase subunit 3 [Oligoflexia bacterium]
MIQRVLASYHLQGLTCVGLLLFLTVFVAALGWVFRRGSGTFYGKLQELPLRDLETLNPGGR